MLIENEKKSLYCRPNIKKTGKSPMRYFSYNPSRVPKKALGKNIIHRVKNILFPWLTILICLLKLKEI